jgi:hypothetical protein
MTSLHLEIVGAAGGVLGTMLLALNGRFAGWGFVAFLVSNVGWIAFAASHGHQFLLAQQACFLITSVLGIWIWLLKPRAHLVRRLWWQLRKRPADPGWCVGCGAGLTAIERLAYEHNCERCEAFYMDEIERAAEHERRPSLKVRLFGRNDDEECATQ